MTTKTLLSAPTTNAKTKKSEVRTWILYLSPSKQNAKGIDVCPHASDGCRKLCLYTAGRGQMSTVQQARTRKTDWLLSDPKEFYQQLAKEIQTKITHYARKRERIAFRLNGTSDIDHVKNLKRYAGLDIRELSHTATFYDYTKSIRRVQKYEGHPNYHLTFSLDERNQSTVNAEIALSMGVNVAVVFNTELPRTYMNAPVLNGDKSDYRPADKQGHIVGLIAKGSAKNSASEFVIK